MMEYIEAMFCLGKGLIFYCMLPISSAPLSIFAEVYLFGYSRVLSSTWACIHAFLPRFCCCVKSMTILQTKGPELELVYVFATFTPFFSYITFLSFQKFLFTCTEFSFNSGMVKLLWPDSTSIPQKVGISCVRKTP